MSRRSLIGGTLLLGASLLWTGPVEAQSLYFHSPREQSITDGLATSLEAARTAHVAALDRHDANLAAAMDRERQALVARELARRDEVAASAIAAGAEKEAAKLKVEVAAQLNHLGLAGMDKIDTSALEGLASDISTIRRRRLELDGSLREYERTALFETANPPACQVDGKGVPATAPQGTAATICDESNRIYAQLVDQVPCSDPEPVRRLKATIARIRSCKGPGGPVATPVAQSILEAHEQQQVLTDALARQRRAARLVSSELQQLRKYIECERKRAANDATTRISAAAARMDAILEDPKAWAEGGDGLPSLGAATRCSRSTAGTTEIVEVPPEPAVRKALRDLLAGAELFGSGRALIAAVEESAQEFRAGELGALLQAAANPAAATEGRGAAIVAALVRSAAPLEQLAQVRAGTLPDTSAVLIDLAEAELRAATSRAEVARLERLAQLAERRVSALEAQAILLIRALREAKAGRTDRSLILYSQSVVNGAAPEAVLAYEMDNAELTSWAARERAAVEASYGVLIPAASQLKAYGESGIKADTVARFLNVAGLAAIAGSN